MLHRWNRRETGKKSTGSAKTEKISTPGSRKTYADRSFQTRAGRLRRFARGISGPRGRDHRRPVFTGAASALVRASGCAVAIPISSPPCAAGPDRPGDASSGAVRARSVGEERAALLSGVVQRLRGGLVAVDGLAELVVEDVLDPRVLRVGDRARDTTRHQVGEGLQDRLRLGEVRAVDQRLRRR